jgi:hypothetical protein
VSPLRAKANAVSSPIPLLHPVMSTTRFVMPGT